MGSHSCAKQISWFASLWGAIMGMTMISVELLKILQNNPQGLDGSGAGDFWIWGAQEGSVGSLVVSADSLLS